MFGPFFGGLNGDDYYPDENDGYPDTGNAPDFVYDPLYYFTKLPMLSKVKEVGKATMLSYGKERGQIILVPTKLIRIAEDKSVWVHTDIGIELIARKMKEQEQYRKENNARA